jgi:lipopolysaccharide/colanic/teichoic acid biosynthesis glycosyltransferase
MSLVGPRPHAPGTKTEGRYFHEVMEDYAQRHRVKPGITGWAQVNGYRGETDTREKLEMRVRHDLYYIDNWSLALDMEVLIRTVIVVLLDRNAY